ncbi:MAG: DinB family protein [Candidatus Eisenbacteria bacterium]|nr:DinB family protein [Candidatus Eisenbacteria bacterium]
MSGGEAHGGGRARVGSVPDPHALPEILAALEANSREIEDFFGGLPNEAFFSGDEQHWGPAHHLSHLSIAHRRVGRGLSTPAKLPRHESARSRTFDQMREAYRARLAQVPPEQLRPNPLPPSIEPGASQRALVDEYRDAAAAMRAAATAWSEDDCDSRAMPHPILGWLSAREMLFFFVHHDRLHLENVRGRLGPG